MAQGQSGRTNKSGSQQTGVNQTASLRIADIRSNYNYPNWFDTTMGYFRDGRISSQAFESAYANLTKQGLITLKTRGTLTPKGSNPSNPRLVPITNPNIHNNHGYNRPSFAHDSDEWGYDYLYGQRDFQSDQDIWKRFSEDLTRHEEQEVRLSDAKSHRDSIEEKVNNAKAEHQKIWDEFSTLHTKHTNQEDRISQKSGIGHTHEGMGGSKECAWYDIGCKMNEGFAGLGKLALIGGVGILAFFLIKKRIGL